MRRTPRRRATAQRDGMNLAHTGRSVLTVLILAGPGTLTACVATTRPPPAASTVPATPEATIPPSGIGYRWTPLDVGQFGGVSLQAVATPTAGGLIGIGTWLTG